METPRFQGGQDRVHALGHGRARGVYAELGPQRRLVGLRDTGKIGDLTHARSLVKPFWVARFAYRERGFDKYLQEFALAQQIANELPFIAEWRNERSDHDQSGVEHQLCRFTDATDILHAVGFRETQIAAKAMSNVIAVEQHRMHARRVQARLERIGDRRLSRSAQAGKPEHERMVTVERGAYPAIHWKFVPNHFPPRDRARNIGTFVTERTAAD